MSNKIKIIVILFIVIIFGGVVILNKDKIIKKTSEKPLTPITVRLKWLHQGQFAGHYVADKKGFYKEKGLDVTLKPFDYVNFPIEEVLSGKAQFGVTGADELLVARENGKKIQAIAVIFQESPVIAYALQSKNIKTPVDFIGKRLGIQGGLNMEIIMRAMLHKQNISYDKDVKSVPINWDVKIVLDNQVDISTGYAINEPAQLKELGYDVNIINPNDYGVNLYGDVLFATEEFIQNNKDLTKRFVQATLKGWEYAINNSQETAEYIVQYKDANSNSLTIENQEELIKNATPFIKNSIGISIGQMNYEQWKKTYELLKKYGMLKTDMEITQAYTTEFLK